MCRDREEYYQDLRNYEREIERMDMVINEKVTVLAERDKIITPKNAMIKKLLAELEALKS